MSRWTMPAACAFAKTLADLRGDVDGVVHVEWPTSDALLERLPLVVGHDEIELPVVCLVDLVDGANVGVVQSGRGLGLLEEALLGGLVAGQVGWQQLDRHTPIQPGIVGRVDDAHPAAAQLRDDLVGPECCAGL